MAGMQFEYDEKGGTFYYFLLSFLALVLFPATYYLWPRRESREEPEKSNRKCQCEPCQVKIQRMKAREPWTNFKRSSIKGALIIGWIIFIFVAYKTSQVELDFTEFDPYKELDIDRGATTSEIKRAYRKLSLIHHPDRGGDPRTFMKISKAYKALTDEETRKNWEEHGNPDGPGAVHFGIALPKWIVEKQNSVWVLAVYGLVFMIILPVVVGTWWYKSIKYSAEQILMDTTQLYYFFCHKTPNMIVKRVIMIVGASMEFENSHNSEVTQRPSDNEELPPLIRDLPHLNEKNKEKPLCFPYSMKARILLHAHFSHLELPPKTLELDRQYILRKSPFLINEMVNIVAQLVALAHARRVSHMPRLDTIENIMKVSQMVIQALWDNKSPLLQLPHISEDMLRHFTTKRRNIRSIHQFVRMNEEERRPLLRSLNDNEYFDVINVCRMMPFIEMEVKSEVLDDEDTTITAGSIVTVTVKLKRQSMDVLLSNTGLVEAGDSAAITPDDDSGKVEEEEEEHPAQEAATESPQKPKIWEKQQKKKKGKGAKGGKRKTVKQPYNRKAVLAASAAAAAAVGANTTGAETAVTKKENPEDSPVPNGSVGSRKRKKSDDGHSSEEEEEEERGSNNNTDDNSDGENDHVEDDEADWLKFQQEAKKENILETKSKETHEVHCPYFPGTKYEWWWLYVADRKNHLLITAPVQVSSLKTEEEVQLKFSAPVKPDKYNYTVILRADSYFDFDISHNIKLDVKEAKKVESHPQWDISEDEEEKEHDEASDSDVTTDSEMSDAD